MHKIMTTLLSLSFTLSPLSADNSGPKVVVIGAGIAGLTTAYRLQEEGVNVSLYEARNRVGGRIFTAYINEIPVELGGKNISDGGESIHLHQLIDEFELDLHSYRLAFEESYFDGRELISVRKMMRERGCDPETLKKEIEEAVSSSQNMQQVLSKILKESDPLYNVIAVKLAAYEGGTIENLSTLYAETLYHMLVGGFCAAHPLVDEERSVEFVSIEGGNSRLPEEMAKKLADSLHLNERLTKVSKGKNGTFYLEFQDGQQVEADFLVLAIPCSLFDSITFEGDLIPSDRLQMIQSVQYGKNAKILIPCSGYVDTPIIMDNQKICFLDNNNMLTAYFTGESSYFSKESIADHYEGLKSMIDLGYAEYCLSSLPFYAQDKSGMRYDHPIGYSWPNDPYVKGSYAYIAPGQEDFLTTIIEKDGEKYKKAFVPIGDTLYFAGEHTSLLLEVPGTMEAACESGERIARAIKAKIEL